MTSAKPHELIGRWRITHMELWDRDYLDLEAPAHITFEKGRLGSFAFGAVQGWVDYRLETRDQRPWVEFSWDGFNDRDPACGRGWAAVTDGRLEGRLFFHQGDESSFVAERTGAPSGKHRASGEQDARAGKSAITADTAPARVSLAAIVEGIEWQSDESVSYLNRGTGEVVTVTLDQLAAAENEDDPEDLADSETEARALADMIDDSEAYLPLPDRFEVDEYRIMARFARGLEDDDVRVALLDALRGRGAFRRFKDRSHALGVIEQWYRYRDEALEQIAVDWCETHGIAFERTAGDAPAE